MEGPSQKPGSIGWAVASLTLGQPVRRKGWNGNPLYVAYVPKGAVQIPQKFGQGNDTGPFLVANLRNKGLVSWTITHSDLIATDWEPAGPAQEAPAEETM